MNTFEAKEPQISRNRDSFRSGLKIKDTHLRQSCTPLFLIQFQNASTTALHESNPNCHAYSLRERESESARNFYNFIFPLFRESMASLKRKNSSPTPLMNFQFLRFKKTKVTRSPAAGKSRISQKPPSKETKSQISPTKCNQMAPLFQECFFFLLKKLFTDKRKKRSLKLATIFPKKENQYRVKI